MLNLARSIVREFRSMRQRWAVQEAMLPLQVNGTFSVEEMRALRKAFSNEGYSGDVDYLMALLPYLGRGPVLECGSGASTLIGAECARRHDFMLYSLEQMPEWSVYVRRFLGDLPSVRVIDAPLKSFGDHVWYDAPGDLPMHFALVICDGPAVEREMWPDQQYGSWRCGVLDYFERTGRTFDVLLLDDANEPRAQRLLDRWRSDFGAKIERVGGESGEYAVVRPR